MRKDIEFKTENGVTLRGWHYVPDGRQGKAPTIVMAHGFSAVKEMYLDRFAEDRRARMAGKTPICAKFRFIMTLT